MSIDDLVGMMQPRTIDGCSAVLLPYLDDGTTDWSGFTAHVQRTADAGLRRR